MNLKQNKSVKHYSVRSEAGSNLAGCEVGADWDTDQAKFSVCQQGELMGSPWFSHVRQTETHFLQLWKPSPRPFLFRGF